MKRPQPSRTQKVVVAGIMATGKIYILQQKSESYTFYMRKFNMHNCQTQTLNKLQLTGYNDPEI